MIRPLGTTPIAYSRREVARDLGGAPGGKMVILVGLKVQLSIVGFAFADEATKWETIPLPEGSHTVVVQMADNPVTIQNVRLIENKSTTVELEKQGQQIGSRSLGP